MNSQTSLVAEQTRLAQWASDIKDCQNRPNGMKIDDWCAQHGITKANYYYRLRRVRGACLASVKPAHPTAFVELPVPAGPSETRVGTDIMAILRNSNGLSLEILAGADTKFIRSVIEAMAYVK